MLGIKVFAQTVYEGKVVNMINGNPIADVLVKDILSNTSTFTNKSGEFKIELTTTTNNSLSFFHLSFLNKVVEIPVNSKSIVVELEENNLRIDEIELVGKKRKNSEIILKEEAINNVQAFTALEVLEQLPGQSVSEFSLNSYKNIVFRTADIVNRNSVATGIDNQESLGNKSFGTAIVVNDIPLSNNGNMQSWVPNASGVFGSSFNQFGVSGDESNTTYSNAGFGTDLRQIATENIEEIEVVQGIPDAKYGDLTSGLVKIKTKAGVTPFISSVSFRDGTTQVNASKGFKINEQLGFLNLGVSYLNSKDDPKNVFNEFNRVNINTDWSLYRKNFKNTLSLAFNTTLDDGTQDPNDVNETFVKNESKNFTLTNRFNYNFNKNWIDALDFNVNFDYQSQYTLRRELVNLGGSVVPVGLESGISQGLYTPVSYYATREIEGKPINAFADVQLHKKIRTTKDWLHQLTAGTTLRYSDNIGAGRLGNPETADDQFTLTNASDGQTGFRPYSFLENVQAEVQYAAYVQDNINKKWNQKTLNVSAGVRWDNQNGYNVITPRINSSFKISDFKMRGGFGIASKAPSLNSTYTGKLYFDNIIGDFRTNTYNVAYVQTFVKEEQNLQLRPTKSINWEFGFDYDFKIFNLGVTAFHKRLEDGLTSLRVYNNVVGDAYQVINNDPDAPTIEITGEETYIYENLRTINGLTSQDYGIEFMLNIPKIEALNIDMNINGMFAKTVNNDVSDIYTDSTIASEEAAIGVFTSSYKTVNKLFRLGTQINYHIPKVGLFLSFKTEHFLMDEFYFDDDFERYPIAYLDQEYNYFAIPEADRTNEQLYGHLFRNEITASSEANIAHNIHVRVSKDFTNGFRIDFYANNFLNFTPTFVDINGDIQSSNITPLSFGMTLNYKF